MCMIYNTSYNYAYIRLQVNVHECISSYLNLTDRDWSAVGFREREVELVHVEVQQLHHAELPVGWRSSPSLNKYTRKDITWMIGIPKCLNQHTEIHVCVHVHV